jgi:hypothetical protein
MEHPMIVLTFTFYVETQLPGGPSADEVRPSNLPTTSTAL